MTPERKAELAAQLGLDRAPELRYEQPDENAPLEHQVNFKKAIQLVDPLRTAAFERYIPDVCVVDQEMDAHTHSEGMSDARLIRTDIPPPLDPKNKGNLKVARATGIPYRLDDQAFFIWLGELLETMWLSYGAYKMAPPLIFAGRGDPKVPGARPFIGMILKLARRPADKPADWGAIVPPGERIEASHRRLPLAVLDDGCNLSETKTKGRDT